MAYELEVNHPDFPVGWEFDCDGVLVENGTPKTLTEEDEYAVYNRSGGLTVKEVYGHKDVPDLFSFSGTKESDLKESKPEEPEEEEEPEPEPEPEVEEEEGGEG